MFSEPSSPTSNKKHDSWGSPADIRDVVKDSMTRKPRVVLVKTVAKGEQKGPKMSHVDSPRLLQQYPKPVTYERRDQNLVKLKETSIPILRGVKEAKQASRFSYDDRESPYKLKSYANIKDHPRLSLDSKQSFIKHDANVVDQSQTHEPESNKPPPSSVVARLMGLDVLNCEAFKIKALKVNALARIPVEPAPWKQEVKQPVSKKVKQRADHACQSVYGQIEKQLTKVEFKTSSNNLRALKSQESLQKVKKVNPGRGHGRNLTSTETKAAGSTKKQVSPSHTTDCLAGTSPGQKQSKIRKQSNGHLTVSKSKTQDQLCRDTCHTRNLSEQSDTSFLSESDASFASQNEPEVNRKDWTRENKLSVGVFQFYDEDPSFDGREWTRVKIDELTSSTGLNQLTSGSNNITFQNKKQPIHQTGLPNSISDKGMNQDHIYIKEILSASGFLKNLDFATTIVHIHPTDTLINPELFNILEKTKACASKSEKIKRKLIFDTVNNILVQKLWTSKRKERTIDGKKLQEELCLEINNLHTNKASDPYDEIINIITEDVNNKSEDWDDYCNEVPALVFDIERVIFNGLVTEIMNAAGWGPQ
ncbi:hypothetical protein L1987_05545 [Smallanthus sonchifolius]|uniref:Uncharacterized protein n=1 Tax=Smallanthus sonchifolius TaxID=185202 RepID=A0ACB9JVP2_9ASTR|nr:hypothetical protein L1987_05545 [Smallanthus sonchifolius]